MTSDQTVLVADIGGTNTRVALANRGGVDRTTIRRYANAAHSGIEEVLNHFLADTAATGVSAACIAAAGPVRDGVARLTNLDWVIDPARIAPTTGISRVAVLNDLQAQGYALGHVAPENLRPLIAARSPRAGSVRLVVGVGTGFNAAPVHDMGAMRLVGASECGHMSLPVHSNHDLQLRGFVEVAHGFAGVEDILSGRGLVRLHDFHCQKAGRKGGVDAASIMQSMQAGDPVAEATGRDFVRILGNVVGDLALVHLPFGGIYLIGGVARAFTDHYERFGLARAFRDKGRFSDFMDAFGLWIIEDDYAALEGCAQYLRETAG